MCVAAFKREDVADGLQPHMRHRRAGEAREQGCFSLCYDRACDWRFLRSGHDPTGGSVSMWCYQDTSPPHAPAQRTCTSAQLQNDQRTLRIELAFPWRTCAFAQGSLGSRAASHTVDELWDDFTSAYFKFTSLWVRLAWVDGSAELTRRCIHGLHCHQVNR